MQGEHVKLKRFNALIAVSFTQGDSGGPLTTVDEGGFHTLIGVVSRKPFGFDCSKQEPAIYTNVQAFRSWIESTIKANGGMASCSFKFSAPPSLVAGSHF